MRFSFFFFLFSFFFFLFSFFFFLFYFFFFLFSFFFFLFSFFFFLFFFSFSFFFFLFFQKKMDLREALKKAESLGELKLLDIFTEVRLDRQTVIRDEVEQAYAGI